MDNLMGSKRGKKMKVQKSSKLKWGRKGTQNYHNRLVKDVSPKNIDPNNDSKVEMFNPKEFELESNYSDDSITKSLKKKKESKILKLEAEAVTQEQPACFNCSKPSHTVN